MTTEASTATAPALADPAPVRVFKMGAVELADPDPALAPLEALRLYSPNYPHLASATLSEPDFRDGQLIYEVEKPPVKTKGARSSAVTPRAVNVILDAWTRGEPHALPAESGHATDMNTSNTPCTLNSTQLHRLHTLLSSTPSARPLRHPHAWYPPP